MADRACKDCIAEGRDGLPRTVRPAPHPGPRCATHHRARKRLVSKRAHGKRVEKVYGITERAYWDLYEVQGGRCAICRRGQGKSRRLAVDHDHSCCSDSTSCGNCVRGLVCGPCNDELAHARDSIEHFVRAILYLSLPPAQKGEQWRERVGEHQFVTYVVEK